MLERKRDRGRFSTLANNGDREKEVDTNRDPSDLRADAVRGAAWSMVGSWGTRVAATLVLIILARILEPGAFGLVAFAAVFTALVALLRDQGFVQAIVQRNDLEDEHVDTAFWTGIAFGVIFALATQFAAGPIARALDAEPLEGVLRWLALGFIIGGARSVPTALLTRQLLFKRIALRNMAAVVIGGAAGVVVAALGGGVWALVTQVLVETSVGAIATWAAVQWRPRFRFSFSHFRELFGFSINVLGITLFNFAYRRGDDFLVGAVLGPAALGFYTIAYRLVRLAGELFLQAVNAVGFPTLARLQEDRPRMIRAVNTAASFGAVSSVPAFVGMALLAPDTIRVIFGPNWEESIPVMQLLALGAIAAPITNLQSQVMLACGKARWSLLLHLCNGIGSLVAFVIAVPYGLSAVAVAFSVRAYVLLPVGFFASRRAVGITALTYLRSYPAPLVATAVMTLSLLAVQSVFSDAGDWLLLASKLVLGAITYLISLRLLSATLFREMVGLAQTALPRRFQSPLFRSTDQTRSL